ncbi:hypothetical protein Q5741_09825 [Paenibacillus sp. JX-17]|uniref:DUF4239 domain-containing protein n=1 Tax=Paenibacillus lacisoli TaxID=3064525 RepID=A0ABT9CBT4_9BACL|nr:hypothetical protein [Paenibacillus sp. JX-17]MDO7906720.1 hypothetical protein [Paenibacillus sp. JX-17]
MYLTLTAWLASAPQGLIPAAVWPWTVLSDLDTLAAVGAAAVLLWLYLYYAVRNERQRLQRANEIQETLYIYTRLAGELSIAERLGSPSQGDRNELLRRLQACKAAPYLTPHLHEQVQACLRDCDRARLELLHRSLEREIHKLTEERTRLLRRQHAPGWGLTWWRLISPAALPAAAGGSLLLIWQLWHESAGLPGSWHDWPHLLLWMRCLSGLLGIMGLYSALTLQRREYPNALSNLLSLAIAALALILWMGEEAAPYVLGAQLLLFLLGFRLTGGRSRKERPYVGHPDLMKMDPELHSMEQRTDQRAEEPAEEHTEKHADQDAL